MARRPEVFVRTLSMEEGRRLARVSRTAKDPVRLRRAIVVMMSGQGQAVRDITSLLQVSADYVRDVIHAFNERGFDALDPKWNGGRPKTIGERVRERICLIARTSPADWGITAFSTWSLTKLRDASDRPRHGRSDVERDVASDPARRRSVVADHHDLEGLHGPGLHRQDAPHPRPLRPATRRRPGGLRRRVRPVESPTPQRKGLAPEREAAAAASDLQPPSRGDAHARRAGPRVPARSTTASVLASVTASSSTSSRHSAPAGPARSSTSWPTTSPHTATPPSAPGALTTRSSWCSSRPTGPG